MGSTGTYLRRLLAVLLSGMIIVPASLAAPQSVAVAGPSQAATVRGAQLTQGANIFNGDIVEVAQGGDSVLLLGHDASVHLVGDSAVRIFQCGDRSVLQLLRGRVIFRSTPKHVVEVQLGDAVTHPDPSREVIGVVALSSPTTANIAAQKGSLTVTTAHQGKSQLVREGEMTEAKLTSPANGGTLNPPICGAQAAIATQPNTAAWVLVGMGTTAIVIALLLGEHQKTLTCAQKGALVSPYQFPCE
jgi:hypothetical protein